MTSPISTLPGCQKGVCMRRATRIATYRSDAGLVEMPSCDEHGMDPATEISQADAARRWNEDNAYWTDDPKETP
jgi:hypothetical protein